MIESFSHNGLRRFFEDDDPRPVPPDMVERVRAILTLLDTAQSIEDMNRPTLHLHALRGRLKGFWAVTVRANWRIVFRFEGGSAHDVDFLDYH